MWVVELKGFGGMAASVRRGHGFGGRHGKEKNKEKPNPEQMKASGNNIGKYVRSAFRVASSESSTTISRTNADIRNSTWTGRLARYAQPIDGLFSLRNK